MATLRIPSGASLPPSFTARERATVDAYFGRANRARRQTIAWFQLMFPLVVALCVVTLAVSTGA